MELTLEQRQTAIAMVEYLREMGYVLSPKDSKDLDAFRAREDEYISGVDAAKKLGCSPAYIIQLRKAGVLKYYLQGSRPMYSVKSLNKYLDKRVAR